eukprot:550518-Lingulodinium_polyedra.AAC.1
MTAVLITAVPMVAVPMTAVPMTVAPIVVIPNVVIPVSAKYTLNQEWHHQEHKTGHGRQRRAL